MEKFSLLLMPVLLMIVAIFCASFSDKIDMAVKGRLIKMIVHPSPFNQLFVVSLLHNSLLREHQDSVGVPDAGKPVGDGECSRMCICSQVPSMKILSTEDRAPPGRRCRRRPGGREHMISLWG